MLVRMWQRVVVPPVMPVAQVITALAGSAAVAASASDDADEHYFCYAGADGEPRTQAQFYYSDAHRAMIGLFQMARGAGGVDVANVDVGALLLAVEVTQGVLAMSVNQTYCVRTCPFRMAVRTHVRART